ncbi:MAG: hypothetical protein ABS44_11495 [Chryseobacterium sp. SCN 40-13]|nr:MAG: hypothetical protein ABS44_11495 [Chryseobacterium sp. SCN 40-13]
MLNKLFFSLSLLPVLVFSQNAIEKCNIQKSYFEDLYRVDAEDVKCLAKNSEKPNTVLVSFARWCAPCLHHLPAHMALEKHFDVDFYILLVDKENDRRTFLAKDYVWKDYPNAKILIIKDYEKRGRGKKYNEFLKGITPPQFEVIDSMSKFFVLNTKGEVQMVTSYKDNPEGTDWKDHRPLMRKHIMPLLTPKEKSE